MDIKEAARRLGKSVITIRRAIKDDKLKASLEGGKYIISDDALNEYALNTQESTLSTQDDQEVKHLQEENKKLDHEINQLRNHLDEREQQIGYLKEQMQEKDKQIRELQKALQQAQVNLDHNQQLLAYAQLPWYRKLRHKALAAPEGVMDMEPEDRQRRDGE